MYEMQPIVYIYMVNFMLHEFHFNKIIIKNKAKSKTETNELSGKLQLLIILRSERTLSKEINPSNITEHIVSSFFGRSFNIG